MVTSALTLASAFLIISNSVNTILGYAFSSCVNLLQITIPESVEWMHSYVFWGCYNLTVCCNFESKPDGWMEDWDADVKSVVWMSNASHGLEYTSNGDGTC